MESASFSERLEESLASLISPCRYTSYEISSSLRPTTILFGCPLPDDLDGASIGERAVAMAFEAILSSAAKMRPYNLYEAMCNAHKQQGNDVTPVSPSLGVQVQCLLMSLSHSQHFNSNHYGTRINLMVVSGLLISWPKHPVMLF